MGSGLLDPRPAGRLLRTGDCQVAERHPAEAGGAAASPPTHRQRVQAPQKRGLSCRPTPCVRVLLTSANLLQVLATAPGVAGQDAYAADAAPAGRMSAANTKPQQQVDDKEDPVEGEVDPDERVLLDLELAAADAQSSKNVPAASSDNAGGAAVLSQPDSPAAGQGKDSAGPEHQAAEGSSKQQPGGAPVASTAAAAPAARLPKVKPGQLGAGGAAVPEGKAAAAHADGTAADSAGAAAKNATADDLADLDEDEALLAAAANSQGGGSMPQASADAEGGGGSSNQKQPQSRAQELNADQQHSDPQAQDAASDGAKGAAASSAADDKGSTEPAKEAGGDAEDSGQPDAEPARDSFPAAKMQALGREAQEAKWAAEDAQQQREAEAAASTAKGAP